MLTDEDPFFQESNGLNDGPRWFNLKSVRYFVLLHDALEGDASKYYDMSPQLTCHDLLLFCFFRAEEIFQSMRTKYGTLGCHLLVINSKPKKVTNADLALPAPDPWLRFLPRKNSKVSN